MVRPQYSIALAGVGQFAAGVEVLRQVIAEREAKKSLWGNYSTRTMMAEVCKRCDHVDEGLTQITYALDNVDITNDRQIELQDLTGPDLVRAQLEAERCFRQALALAQNRQTRLMRVTLYRSRSNSSSRIGTTS